MANDKNYQSVTLADLVSNPSKFNGERVSVSVKTKPLIDEREDGLLSKLPIFGKYFQSDRKAFAISEGNGVCLHYKDNNGDITRTFIDSWTNFRDVTIIGQVQPYALVLGPEQCCISVESVNYS